MKKKKQLLDQYPRHDCGNPNCIEFRKQCLFDKVFVVLNEAHDMICNEQISDPMEALELGFQVLRNQVAHEDVIQQAQIEKQSQKFSH